MILTNKKPKKSQQKTLQSRHRVDSVVILAAGRGRRLNAITVHTPKPLLKGPDKLPLVERLIQQIQSKVTRNIIVVVGYQAEKFAYLQQKYQVRLMFNSLWQTTNNVTSFAVALPFMGNTVIVNGDVYMTQNLFRHKYPAPLTYVEKNNQSTEWLVHTNTKNEVQSFEPNPKQTAGLFQKEVTFVTSELVFQMRKLIKTFKPTEYYEFFVLACCQRLGTPLLAYEVPSNVISDVDDIQQLRAVCT